MATTAQAVSEPILQNSTPRQVATGAEFAARSVEVVAYPDDLAIGNEWTVAFDDAQQIGLHLAYADSGACFGSLKFVDTESGNVLDELLLEGKARTGQTLGPWPVHSLGIHWVPDVVPADGCGQIRGLLIDTAMVATKVEPVRDHLEALYAAPVPTDDPDALEAEWHVDATLYHKVRIRYMPPHEAGCVAKVSIVTERGQILWADDVDPGGWSPWLPPDWYRVIMTADCSDARLQQATVDAEASIPVLTPGQELTGRWDEVRLIAPHAPWMRVQGGVPMPKSVGPVYDAYERIDFRPRPEIPEMVLFPPQIERFACGGAELAARFVRDEVCREGRAWVHSDGGFVLEARRGGIIERWRVDQDLIISGGQIVGTDRDDRPGEHAPTCRSVVNRNLCLQLPGYGWTPVPDCNPHVPYSHDTDNDLLDDYVERCITFTEPKGDVGCGPDNGRDTDGDGHSDGWEVCGAGDLPPNTWAGGPHCRDLLYEALMVPSTSRLARAEVLYEALHNTGRDGHEPLFFNLVRSFGGSLPEIVDTPWATGSAENPSRGIWRYVREPSQSCSSPEVRCEYTIESDTLTGSLCTTLALIHDSARDPRCGLTPFRRTPELWGHAGYRMTGVSPS